MIIAYLTNVYARASDSFIRAEVLELRRFGHTVHTFSIREAPASELVSPEIQTEHNQTDYILKRGAVQIAGAFVLEFLRAPIRALETLAIARRCGWPGFKGRLWPWIYFFEACYLALKLREKKVEHLHNHIGEGSAAVAMLAAHLAGISYSLTIHGPFEFDHPEILALGEKIKRCRFAVTISAYGRSQLCRWTDPADWPKIQVVRCGVKFDSAVMPPASGRNLISIGRLSPEKGHLVLLDAAAKLKNEPAFQITVVGDGPLRPLLEKRIVELGLAERVRLTGWLPADRVREEIIRSRAMVHASFAEGLPVVFMESLALGRPVIGTAIAGIPELIEPGISGWLVPAGSIEDLANAMHEALSREPAKLAAMGQAGAARVRERHDQTFEARKLEKLFQKRIDKRCQSRTLAEYDQRAQ